MSTDSSQRRVRPRTKEAINATLAKVENRHAILERNVLIANLSVAPLDFIAEIIRDNHWGYLYNCACIVYPRLVGEFYGYLEMVQDEDLGIILQTKVQGHVIQIDPLVISDIIDVSILALFCVWTKSFMCNDAVNRDSTFRVMSEDSAFESEEFQVPCQPSGRCIIPSGRPSVYCSIRPDDVSFRPDIRQTSIIFPDGMLLPSGHLHRIEKLLCQLSPSGRFSSTSGRLSVLERFTDSFQAPRKGRSINHPDDVVSRPDAYLRKARIAVQNEPLGHLTVVVRTLVHRIW
jgi:hypothetical protein